MMKQTNDESALRHTRWESMFVVALWCASGVFSVGYCYSFGYDRPVEDLRFIWGIPDWVFWGIVVPWALCLLIGFWYSFAFMKDEDLGEEEETQDAPPFEKESGRG